MSEWQRSSKHASLKLRVRKLKTLSKPASAMLTRLFLLIACSISTTPLFVGGTIASPGDIGGAPVKAVPTPTTYTPIYSQTNYIDQFGVPQSIIIVAPTYTYDSFGFSSTFSVSYPQTVIVNPNRQTTTIRGLLIPSVPYYPSQSCNQVTLGLASGRSVSIHSSSGCW